jgi:allantoin racemase
VGGTHRSPSHGSMMHLIRKMVREYGIVDRVVSIRTTGLCVEDCVNEEMLFDSLYKESLKSISDGAEVIILGCTGMTGIAEALQDKLDAPVVDPSVSALKFAELLLTMDLTHSKLTIPSPEMVGVKCVMKWPPTLKKWPR